MASESKVEPLGNGRFEIVSGEHRRVAYAVRHGSESWVFIDGRVYVVSETTASRGRGHRDDLTALAAPMPATVVSVNVAAGQQVKAGDTLVTLEAMKMELAIKAPRDGVIRAISCRVGELVQPGNPLVDLAE